MNQLEDEIKSAIKDHILKDNKYCSPESIERLVEYKLDRMAEWLVNKFLEETK